jgi:uncharacterized cupin superfamily protein
MTNNVIHLPDVALTPESHGETFASREARVGSVIGMRQLGCTLIVVPPTKIEPEICEYPDSDKVLAFDGFGERARNATKLDVVVRKSANVDYWDGEG